jgi:hypothetical protein
VKNPYIAAIERRMNNLRATKTEYWPDPGGSRGDQINKGDWQGSYYEFELFTSLLKEFQKIDQKFSIPFVSKLRKIADSCEAGGHKSRARMFRAVAKEFETREEVKSES